MQHDTGFKLLKMKLYFHSKQKFDRVMAEVALRINKWLKCVDPFLIAHDVTAAL